MADDETLFEIMRTTRAMRRLKPDPIGEDVLIKLVEAAQMAPSGSNQQNGRWIIVRDQARKERIAALNKNAVDTYMVRRYQQMNDLPPAQAESQRRILKAVQWQAAHMAEAPALLLTCLELRAPPTDTFIGGVGAGGSIWPAVQNILLAARSLGLGAAPTTLAFTDRQAFKDAVGLPPEVEPVCLIPLGYPLGKFGPVARKPIEDVLRWDSWS